MEGPNRKGFSRSGVTHAAAHDIRCPDWTTLSVACIRRIVLGAYDACALGPDFQSLQTTNCRGGNKMTKNLWKMFIVGLILVGPAVCSALTVAEAVATAGDGKYVQMDPGSSITLNFAEDCYGKVPAIILKLAHNSMGIDVKFYNGGTQLYDSTNQVWSFETVDWYGPDENPDSLPDPLAVDLEVGWCAVPFDSVVITVIPGGVLYLDAVEGAVDGDGDPVAWTSITFGGTVTPLTDDPVEMTADLVLKVASFNLQQGIENSLDAKLSAAWDALNDINENNDASAVNKLEAFINEVEAQRDKKIEGWQADALIAGAQKIISILTGT